MKQLFFWFSLIILSQQLVVADELTRSSSTRTVSLSGTIGELEALGMGINYQINDSYSIGGMIGGYWIGGPGYMIPNNARGIGIRGSYYFDPTGNGNFLYFNTLSCGVMYLFQDDYPSDDHFIQGLGGAGMDFMVGHDNIVGKGVGFVWAVGVSASVHQSTPPLVLPACKWGMHIDL